VNLTHNYEVSTANLNHEWFNTQNLLDSPLDKTTKAYFFFFNYSYFYIYTQAIQCSTSLSFIIDPCNDRSMTIKPDDFRVLGVKHLKVTRVKNATTLNLGTLSIKENFHFLTRILNA
jgi:hypothetical protein